MQLLGVVENMTSEVFGSGGGERLADRARREAARPVPLDARIREAADAGTPLVLSDPDSEPARAIAEIAARDRHEPRRRLHAHAAACLLTRRAQRLDGARVLGADDVEVLAAHFLDAEARGRAGHGRRADRVARDAGPISTPSARPRRVVSEPGYERWDGNGALGYLVLNAIVEAQLADPPQHARLVVAGRTFPTGMLGYWARRLADGGLVAALTATSPRRLGHPDGGPKLDRDEPARDRDPVLATAARSSPTSRWGTSPTATCSPAGRARTSSRRSAASTRTRRSRSRSGSSSLVDALTPDDGFGAVLLVARPEADPVPAFRELAGGARLPGDR